MRYSLIEAIFGRIVLDEARWNAWRIIDRKRSGNPIEVDAKSNSSARRIAADEFGDITMFNVEVEELDYVPIDALRASQRSEQDVDTIRKMSIRFDASWREHLQLSLMILSRAIEEIERTKNYIIDIPWDVAGALKKVTSSARIALEMISKLDVVDQDDSLYLRGLLKTTQARVEYIVYPWEHSQADSGTKISYKTMGLLKSLRQNIISLLHDPKLGGK